MKSMTKLEALTELAAKVEAGETPKRDLVSKAFKHRDDKHKGFGLGELIHWIMQPDDIRAMGAAMALHEAVLPGWCWNISNDNHAAVWGPSPSTWSAYSDNPARAWLLTIIRALIAQERTP